MWIYSAMRCRLSKICFLSTAGLLGVSPNRQVGELAVFPRMFRTVSAKNLPIPLQAARPFPIILSPSFPGLARSLWNQGGWTEASASAGKSAAGRRDPGAEGAPQLAPRATALRKAAGGAEDQHLWSCWSNSQGGGKHWSLHKKRNGGLTIEGGAPCIGIAEFVNITPITWVYGRYMEVS